MPSVISTAQPVSSSAEIDAALVALSEGANRLATMTISDRRRLLRGCLDGTVAQAERWVEAACAAKRIPAGSGARAEEVIGGPLTALRYLHLLQHTLSDIQRTGSPQLPGRPYQRHGRWRVPVFPTSHLYDRLLFRPLRAETWMQAGVNEANLFGANLERISGAKNFAPQTTLVLGAGNVSGIPITDALTKLFQFGQAVLLKMNPVNQYLGPIFEDALAPLLSENLLRIVYGGADVGSRLIEHSGVDEVHITGSSRTHDAIVWGADPQEQTERRTTKRPLLSKPITSELGNVSPWILVPGHYTARQLYFQAENIVASITNNASFNCISTKMLITWRQWPQRARFLDQLETILKQIPPRHAYYPGAVQRYEQYASRQVADPASTMLPWTLLRNIDPEQDRQLFEEESFVCVCGEVSLDAANEDQFLSRATAFANERMWGTLAAALTVPSELQGGNTDRLDEVLAQLRYGTIGVNQWPGVAYGLMSAPWGGYPGTTLDDVQSGIGYVHNTYLLDRSEKTVLSSPLTMTPKPMWFSTHRCAEDLAWRLLELYKDPRPWRVVPVLLKALRG